MAEEEDKQEEKFELDSTGQALGYISLDQAGVLAIQAARGTPGEYGSQYQDVSMAFEVSTKQDTEDYYVVTLSFRPQGDFSGTPGQEQFFIEKEGTVAVRQVLSLPRLTGWRRFPLLPVAIGLVMVGVIAAVAAVFMLGGTGDDGGLVADDAIGVFVGASSTANPVRGCDTLTGTDEALFVGDIGNSTASVTTDFQIWISQSVCQVSGQAQIGVGLYGSGPFAGSLTGSNIDFTISEVTNDAGLDIIFSGSFNQSRIAGDYTVPSTGEVGRWEVLQNPTASSYFIKGRDYYDDEKYQQAIAEFTNAIRLNPNVANYYEWRGGVYYDLGQYQLAIQDSDVAIRLSPDHSRAYNSRGIAYDSLGQYQNAIADYDRAIQLEPDFATVYINRGAAYRNLGQHAEADADETTACSLDSKYC